MSTPETFDITDFTSLATQGPPPFQLFYLPSVLLLLLVLVGQHGQHHWPLSPSRTLPEVDVVLEVHRLHNISSFPPTLPPPSSCAAGCPRWWRPWAPSPEPPPPIQSCLLTDPEDFWLKQKVSYEYWWKSYLQGCNVPDCLKDDVELGDIVFDRHRRHQLFQPGHWQ